MHRRFSSPLLFTCTAIVLASGCDAVLGLGDFKEGTTGTGGGSTTTGTGGGAGTTTTGTGGVAATCMDSAKNGQETDVDCGGPCMACSDGKGCLVPQDCKSAACVMQVCAEPACNDTVKDGSETDVDCGGACPMKCADGKACAVAGDCIDGICNAAFTCEPPTCSDGVVNGKESGVDCGGGTCKKCDAGQPCKGSADCVSTFCENMACKSNLTWARGFGDASLQMASGLAVNNQGTVFLTGTFDGAIDFGAGPLVSAGLSDIFLARLGPGGALVYGKRFGDDQTQVSSAISVGIFDTVSITGAIFGNPDFGSGPIGDDPLSMVGGDAFLAYFDKNGAQVQAQRFNGNFAQYGTAITQTDTGGYAWGGDLTDTVDFGCNGPLASAGNTDIFIVSPNGACWAKRFGDVAAQNLLALSLDGGDNLWAAGKFMGTLDFGGSPLTMNAGAQGAFAAKLDQTGARLWSSSFGNATSQQEAQSIAATAAGGAIVAGSFFGSMNFGGGITLNSAGLGDLFVTKLDGNGAAIWAKAFGDVDNQVGHIWVATDFIGDVFLAGDFQGTIDFGGGPMTSAGEDDLFVVKLDPGGSFVWGQRYGDAASQRMASIAVRATTQVFIAGSLQGSVDFGGTTVTSNGSYDVFAAQLELP